MSNTETTEQEKYKSNKSKNLAVVEVRLGRVLLQSKSVNEEQIRKALSVAGDANKEDKIISLKHGEKVQIKTMNHSYIFTPIFQEDV
ncbi:hypothetical protein [Marinicella marina]|uniref:hypothetical protein n=1 Tax=Marinicella marina TaxID=2996016 RepID=UPI0024BCF778|nr:hypothetical protein [Marinicella marina]MDJ1139613.1 hypothetical protein [Marinicella marina]